MFKLFKRLFGKPRLIERYENLNAIIDAHNELIRKTVAMMKDTSVPPKYVLMRFNAIQESEEKAIAAYWRNKKNKYDKWINLPKTPENSNMSDIVRKIEEISHEIKEFKSSKALPLPQTVEALPPTETQSTTQLPEKPPEQQVIEIHIDK